MIRVFFCYFEARNEKRSSFYVRIALSFMSGLNLEQKLRVAKVSHVPKMAKMPVFPLLLKNVLIDFLIIVNIDSSTRITNNYQILTILNKQNLFKLMFTFSAAGLDIFAAVDANRIFLSNQVPHTMELLPAIT